MNPPSNDLLRMPTNGDEDRTLAFKEFFKNKRMSETHRKVIHVKFSYIFVSEKYRSYKFSIR